MTQASTVTAFRRGLLDTLPFLLVVIPFSLLFGVLATEAGLSVVEVMGFCILVIAGAAQFAALQLMTENAPVVLVLTTALIVNLRMAMYSAALAPYLGGAPLWQRGVLSYFLVDQTFAVGVARFEQAPEMTLAERTAFFAGTAVTIAPVWYAFTLVGAVLGARIPDGYGLDFALPLAFLAMVAPMLRTLPHMAAALTSIVLALALAGLPSGLGLIVAGLVAMAVGAATEQWMERRA